MIEPAPEIEEQRRVPLTNARRLFFLLQRRRRQFFFHFVALHRPCDDVLAIQLLLGEIDHAYLAVLIRSEVEPLGFEIAGAGPERIIGYDVSVGVFLGLARRAFWN